MFGGMALYTNRVENYFFHFSLKPVKNTNIYKSNQCRLIYWLLWITLSGDKICINFFSNDKKTVLGCVILFSENNKSMTVWVLKYDNPVYQIFLN